MTAEEVIKTRVKVSEHMSNQLRKDGFIVLKKTFNPAVVNTSDMSTTKTYYGGIIFIPSFPRHYCEIGCSTTTTDAANFPGVSPQLYGTMFQVSVYDGKRMSSLLSFHTLCGRRVRIRGVQYFHL